MRHAIVLLLVTICPVISLGQETNSTTLDDGFELTALFPEVPGCVKRSGPIERTDKVVRLEISYGHSGDDANRMSCGHIRMIRGAGAGAFVDDDSFSFPWEEKVSIDGFRARRQSPMCGNDPWLGSLTILLAEDQMIEFSANVGAGSILEIDKLDLPLISDRIRIWLK